MKLSSARTTAVVTLVKIDAGGRGPGSGAGRKRRRPLPGDRSYVGRELCGRLATDLGEELYLVPVVLGQGLDRLEEVPSRRSSPVPTKEGEAQSLTMRVPVPLGMT